MDCSRIGLLIVLALIASCADSSSPNVVEASDAKQPDASSTDAADAADGADATNGNDATDSSDGSDGSHGTDSPDGSDSTDQTDATDGIDGTDGVDGTDGTDLTDGTDGIDGADGTNGQPDPLQPTLYPANQIHSPLTPLVVDRMNAIATLNPDLQPNVFMKVGASSTVSGYNLKCFAKNSVDLDVDAPILEDTLVYYLEGDAAGTTPYERKTLAAKSGMSAGWAIKGNPAPVEAEIDAILPTSAIVHYGANDMGQASSYQKALFIYADRMLTLVDLLIDNGVIPVVMNITPRGDAPKSNRWIPGYNAVSRGIAQARQTPYVDLFLAVQNIPGYGLAGDGLHLNVYKNGGSSKPCIMTNEALQYGFNVRNLLSLQALDGVYSSVGQLLPAPDVAIQLPGTGSPKSPFVIETLPFTDLRDTSASPHKNLTTYTGCTADQDESGPEYLYKLVLTETTRLRAMVFDRGSVDVDLHLLDDTASESGCIERDHEIIQSTLQPGTYYLALDSFVSGGTVKSGEYLLVVTTCHPDDAVCD